MFGSFRVSSYRTRKAEGASAEATGARGGDVSMGAATTGLDDFFGIRWC